MTQCTLPFHEYRIRVLGQCSDQTLENTEEWCLDVVCICQRVFVPYSHFTHLCARAPTCVLIQHPAHSPHPSGCASCTLVQYAFPTLSCFVLFCYPFYSAPSPPHSLQDLHTAAVEGPKSLKSSHCRSWARAVHLTQTAFGTTQSLNSGFAVGKKASAWML